ncbi:methyltransferase domain protein [Leptospira interrogans serovar Pomona str. Kennewicki LC82-25]|nr:methyltransferase domain protein [Leptospira interrogans serovar Pomona str. Kennewicki LC82-25]EKR84911.1 methyltransferase domain protein [Leptospira interrogans str. UI 08452]EMN33083.1 methyltransferase domain protein [Leptospira interrogans serovar Medanensis str. L0448]EMN41961.1 methyltransferase domain protein [Leptospira interrogans str. L0996]
MFNPLSSVEPWSLVAEGYTKSTKQFLECYALKAMELMSLKADYVVLDVQVRDPFYSTCKKRKGGLRDRFFDSYDRAIEERDKRNKSSKRFVFTYVMDGQKLENDRFDAAFSMFGLMFFPDKVRGLKEIHRVLKPKGKIAVSSWAPISNSILMQCLFGALRKANPDIPPLKQI